MKHRLAMLIVATLWGASFAFQKTLLNDISPATYTAWSFGLAGLFFLLIALFKKEKITFRLREGVILGVWLAVMELLQTFGLALTTASNTVFITNIGLILIPVFGFLLYRHKVRLHSSFLLVISVLGLYLFVGGVSNITQGDLLVIGSALGMAMYFLQSGLYEKEKGSSIYTLCAQQFLMCSVIGFIVGGVGAQNLSFPKGDIAYLFLLQTALFTILPYFLVQVAEKVLTDIEEALFGILEPIIGGITAFLVLGELWNYNMYIGACAILFALFAGEYFQSKKQL